MKHRKLLSDLMAIVVAAALFVAFVSGTYIADAQASPVPTPTRTPKPATPTSTPIGPTSTPPPPTNTPPPPTPTPLPYPPSLTSFGIDPPGGQVQLGAPIDVGSILYHIPSGSDQYLVEYDWGDGTVTSCLPESEACEVAWGTVTIMSCPVPGPVLCPEEDMVPVDVYGAEVTGRHTYSEPGVYPVQLTVRDEFGQFATGTFEFIVIYDPDGGFVTGGGWIDSQPGSYKPDPDLTGKASFGFVSKYQKGANQPTGNTQFQFHVADLNFQSDSYQWLVVNQAGTRAQFKGSGTINGAQAPSGEDYKFMIWAYDGEPDTFRIKIWYDEGLSDIVAYDNGFDQPISSGSITVHTAND